MREQTIKGKPTAGRAVLSYEQDMVKSHSHSATLSSTDLGSPYTTNFDYGTKSTAGFDYGTRLADENGWHEHAMRAAEANIALNGGGSTRRMVDATIGWSGGLIAGSGSHQHWIGIGAHAHDVYIGGHSHQVPIGAHSHTVTIAPFGGVENTVKNIALNYLVRLA
jgi:hypothetical protein